jgi:TctA family transporter
VDMLHNVFYGFSIALQPDNLMFAFVGAVLGTLIGVLPGIGPVGAISILLPITFKMPATGAIIMLAGIYYGAMYGGSTTSILVNIPGEAGSVVTCLDGYKMALKGKAGSALGMAAFGSFIAGTVRIFCSDLSWINLCDIPVTRIFAQGYNGLLFRSHAEQRGPRSDHCISQNNLRSHGAFRRY